jgi:glycosyltransferase involved in cell wall biosynthesis
MAKRLNDPERPVHVDFPVLHGLGNDLVAGSISARVFGKPDIGMVFLEDTRAGEARSRAARYRLLLAGSTWNAETLRGFGIDHVEVCPQGVDTALFRPQARRGVFGERFVVFSGGKLEFRKAQDIVITAFRIFQARHPDALLLTAWLSPFPGVAADLVHSPHRTGTPDDVHDPVAVSRWLEKNGLPPGSYALVPAVANAAIASWLSEADAAVFVSRAEGGTNLAAMEALACGVPTILSANTGHLDLIATVPCLALGEQRPVALESMAIGTQGWGETDPEALVDALEHLHAHREEVRGIGRRAAVAMKDWSWSKRIDDMLAALTKAGAWPAG